jgi:archaellum component FlaC
MATIEEMTITSPPNTLFQGISTNYLDNLTYVEYLLGILKKMNEVIEQVNSNTSFIENYDGRINALEVEIANLKDEIEQFENSIEIEFDQLAQDLEQTIDERLVTIRSELNQLLYAYRNESRAYTDTRVAELQAEIDNILIGEIVVHDPTTGFDSPLQTVINNIYDSTRSDAITATEYDGLQLTATAYDGYQITAFNYDQFAKSILMA